MRDLRASSRESVVVVSQRWKGWRWFADEFPEIDFHFFDDAPNRLERLVRVRKTALARGCLRGVLAAKRLGARVLIAHGPRRVALCGAFARVVGLRAHVLGFTFNFTDLPTALTRRFFARALARVERLVVFSAMERELYASAFRLPEHRFDVVHWAARSPSVAADRVEAGDYVCAVGGNARDYATLLRASERIPEVPLVLVVRPASLRGLRVPAHVRVHVDLEFPEAMNVLRHARFMVLPLAGSEVPCGHVTLVASMHLGRPFVVTGSSGVAEYVVEGVTGVTCAPFDPAALAERISELWRDPERVERMGREARAFGERHCSERTAVEHLRGVLVHHGVLPGDRATGSAGSA